MGIRPKLPAAVDQALRLDGQPITWWHAFERTGGYAAGLATGTLGFAQVYWDPNRQAIHDTRARPLAGRDVYGNEIEEAGKRQAASSATASVACSSNSITRDNWLAETSA